MEQINEQLRRDFPGAKLRHANLKEIAMDKRVETAVDMNDELDRVVDEINKRASTPTPEKLVPRPIASQPLLGMPYGRGQTAEPSLSDKLASIDRASRQLRQDLDTQRMELLAEHDRRWTETQHDFARKIHEETVKLENARDAALQKLSDEYHAKKRELDFIAARIG